MTICPQSLRPFLVLRAGYAPGRKTNKRIKYTKTSKKYSKGLARKHTNDQNHSLLRSATLACIISHQIYRSAFCKPVKPTGMKKLFALTILFAVIFTISSFNKNDHLASGPDEELYAVLKQHGFDGRIENQLEIKLGRKLDKKKAELGRLIFFDKGLGLHQDNSCAGCHAPAFGFGDSQPMAIGVDNNNIVGPHRDGPRNQRRTPSVINTAFFPALMWNSRFRSLTNDPFNNTLGFEFPPPEGDSLFSIQYNYVKSLKHLLVAQAHIPFTELPEMAGFTNTANTTIAFSGFSGLTKENNQQKATPLLFLNKKTGNKNNEAASSCIDPDFSVFDDGHGLPVPPVDPHYNSSNFGIRAKVLDLINGNPEYIKLFKEIYPQVPQKPVDFRMVGEVVAEFEFSLVFATAPLDKFAMGNKNAMTETQKKGALIFFGKGKCVNCHSVSGNSSQMFSDFISHNAGTPQIHPVFGSGTGNVPFSQLGCPNKTANGTLDYGREEFTGNMQDRYKFRTSPLRNLKLQSSFFHNGSFKNLKKALVYHLDPVQNISAYNPGANGIPPDLHYRAADMPNVMLTVDPLLKNGIHLTQREINDLYDFLREALYDDKASPERMQKLIPKRVPSGVPMQVFEDRILPDEFIVNAPADDKTISLSVMGNPSASSFTISIKGTGKSVMTLQITNAAGRPIEQFEALQSGQQVTIGQTYHRGVYYAVLIQGDKKEVMKLIKL